MPVLLMGIVAVLIGVAIAVQVYYLVGLKRAGIDVSKTTVVVSVVNITLLALVGVGLIIFILINWLTAVGM